MSDLGVVLPSKGSLPDAHTHQYLAIFRFLNFASIISTKWCFIFIFPINWLITFIPHPLEFSFSCWFTGFLVFFFFFFFRTAPEAYRSSQARGQIRATATSHSLSNTGSKLHIWLTSQLTQGWIPDTLSKDRDRTCILMDSNRICSHCTTMGTLVYS